MDGDNDTDDTQPLSPDDALEEERSANDGGLVDGDDDPAAPADDLYETTLPVDHPDTDSDLDETEVYQEGLPTAPNE